MNVLVVENEKPAATGLCKLLQTIDHTIQIVGIAESVEATLNWLQAHPPPDLLFMDIQLDDGLCFEIFETHKVFIPVIFTTAYDKYTLSAFKMNSVDYLLKPIEESLLREAIEKFKTIHYQTRISNNYLSQLFTEKKTYKKRFLIKVGEHYKSIQTCEIACFYILERVTFIRTFVERDYAVDYSLDQLQKNVDPALFFRINRNCLINMNAIRDMVSYSSSRLKLTLTGSKPMDDLIVSKDKVQAFKTWIDS